MLVVFRGYLIWASGEYGRCPFDDDGLHESVKSLCGLNGHRSMLLETSAWARAPELRGCLPAAGLAFVCLYSSFALSGFVLQQLLFQVLVPARTRGGAADRVP